MRHLVVPNLSIPLILKNYFDDTQNEKIYVVIIGANDGDLDDFLTPHLHSKQLSGLLVEPLKDSYHKLIEKYKGNTNLVFENAAIYKKNGRSTMYKIKNDTEKKGWHNGLGSLKKSVITAHENQINNIHSQIIKETVRCITFLSLIKKHTIKSINILQIDTEGYDYEIIRSIDFAIVKPDIIIFEYLLLTFYQYYSCLDLLNGNGYVLNKNDASFDVIAINSDLI